MSVSYPGSNQGDITRFPWLHDRVIPWHGDMVTQLVHQGTALEADEILALHTRMETPNRPAILRQSKWEAYTARGRTKCEIMCAWMLCTESTTKRNASWNGSATQEAKTLLPIPARRTSCLPPTCHSLMIWHWPLEISKPWLCLLDQAGTVQSTYCPLRCWSFFLRWHSQINASNEKTCT